MKLPETDWNNFEQLDIRVGTIISAIGLQGAKKAAYALTIDFGPLGILSSSAQITRQYKPDTLLQQQVIAVVNFPPKQIGKFKSECLVLGIYTDDSKENVVLIQPQQAVDNGTKIG